MEGSSGIQAGAARYAAQSWYTLGATTGYALTWHRLVCSSKLVHIFFGTVWYDVTWYVLACNLRVPWESNTTLASIGPDRHPVH